MEKTKHIGLISPKEFRDLSKYEQKEIWDQWSDMEKYCMVSSILEETDAVHLLEVGICVEDVVIKLDTLMVARAMVKLGTLERINEWLASGEIKKYFRCFEDIEATQQQIDNTEKLRQLLRNEGKEVEF